MFKAITKLVKSTALKRTALLLGSFVGIFAVTGVALATTPTAIGLSSIGHNVDTSVYEMARVLTDIALVAGVGFIMAAFFKFHQHKLNPQQIQISQGVTLLLIGAGLTLFPTLIPTTTKAIFGSSAKIAKVGGSQIGGLIGKGTGS